MGENIMSKIHFSIKKFFVYPIIIITILTNLLFVSYNSPSLVQVEAATTGNLFIDLFITALQICGFSITSTESAEAAQKDFISYIHQMRKDNSEALDKIIAANNSTRDVKDQYLRYVGVDEGHQLTYEQWYKTIYCVENNISIEQSDFDLFKTISEYIAVQIDNGNFNSNYTSIQYLSCTGTFSLLVMLVKDWLLTVGTKTFDTAKDIYNQTIGKLINYTSIVNSSFYKFLSSSECDDIITHFVNNNSYPQSYASGLVAAKNTFLNNLPSDLGSYLSSIGSKYILIFRADYGSTGSIFILDVPEDVSTLIANKSYSNSNGYYYYYDFLDSKGNIISKPNYKYLFYYGSAEEYSFPNVENYYYSWSYFNPLFIHCFFNSSSGINTDDICIPFGLENVSIDNSAWSYTPSDYYDIDTGAYSGAVAAFDIEKTNSDLSDTVATNIDCDDVEAKTVAQVIDDADSIAADTSVSTAIDKDITDVLDKAQEIADTDTDTDTDTKTDTDIAIDVPDEAKDYTPSLVEIFPFCIPYDIYRFFKCLQADPVAPCFTIPLIVENSYGIPEYSLEIDFSKFDSVAKILRIMELLAFCVGLAMATNKLIKH